MTDPQSLNRYAYTENDPVNFTDPTGLCSFNIAITGGSNLTDDQNTAFRNEIKRIFRTAGRGVNFVTGTSADYTLNITHNAPASVPANAAGATVIHNNAGAVYIDRLNASATMNDASRQAFNMNSNAIAIALARAGSHEIGHYLLGLWTDSTAFQGVMHAGFSGDQWFTAAKSSLWMFTAQQKLDLVLMCMRLRAAEQPVTTPNDLPESVIIPQPTIPMLEGTEGSAPDLSGRGFNNLHFLNTLASPPNGYTTWVGSGITKIGW